MNVHRFRWASGASALLAALAFCTGCAGGGAPRQEVTDTGDSPAPHTENAHAQTQQSQQTGNVPVSAQVDASGWTGLSYQSVLPVGVAVLLIVFFVTGEAADFFEDRRRLKRELKLIELVKGVCDAAQERKEPGHRQ